MLDACVYNNKDTIYSLWRHYAEKGLYKAKRPRSRSALLADTSEGSTLLPLEKQATTVPCLPPPENHTYTQNPTT